MSHVLQWAQLSVASAQLSEIHNLNAQFQQQQDSHRRQAVLADMLFQTERRTSSSDRLWWSAASIAKT